MPRNVAVDWAFVDNVIRTKAPLIGFTAVGREVGLSDLTIRRRAKKLGVESLASHKMRLNRETLKVDLFDTWAVPMAYSLGYIWADGSLEYIQGETYSLGLACSTRDEGIILGIRELLCSNHQVTRLSETFNEETGLRRDPFTRVTISSKALLDSLLRRELRPNKSNLNLPFPEVPGEYMGHFLRGYLDGDGNVYHRIIPTQVQRYLYFKGTPLFVKGIQDVLVARLDLPRNKILEDKESPNCHRVVWSRLEDLAKLYTLLYPPGDYPFLARKRQKLELILA